MWGESSQAIRVRFEPPTAALGIAIFRATFGGSSCDVSADAADLSCLIQGLDAATRYAVQGVACDENNACSSAVEKVVLLRMSFHVPCIQ